MVALRLKMQKLRFSFHLGLNLEAFSVCEVFIKSLKSPTKIKSVFLNVELCMVIKHEDTIRL